MAPATRLTSAVWGVSYLRVVTTLAGNAGFLSSASQQVLLTRQLSRLLESLIEPIATVKSLLQQFCKMPNCQLQRLIFSICDCSTRFHSPLFRYSRFC